MTISSITSKSVAIATSESVRSFVQSSVVTPKLLAPKNSAEVETLTPPPSSERVSQAVNQVNEAFTQKGQNLYASIERDKETGIPVVKVLDKHTNEVISQFPSKEIIAIAQAISQSQDEKGKLIHVSA